MSLSSLSSTIYKRLKILLGSSHADEHAHAALISDNEVAVDITENIELRPRRARPTSGIVLYPGGRCDPIAYVPLLRKLAREGYLCVIARMPLNLPVLSPDRATAIMATYPEIKNWVIGGHSLGGAMACRFAARNSEKISGLFLLASYPPESQDLSHCDFPVTLLYGTEDTFASAQKIRGLNNVPGHAVFAEIKGGDHYQFGSFRDCTKTASISRLEQHEKTINVINEGLGIIGLNARH